MRGNPEWSLWWLWVMVALIAWIASGNLSLIISLEKAKTGDIAELLATVLFAAIVIERAVEVYIKNTFQSAEFDASRPERLAKSRVDTIAAELDAKVATKPATGADAALQAEIDRLGAALESARAGLADAQAKCLPDKDAVKRRKSRVAAWMSTLFALSAAAVGIRIFGQFIVGDAGLPVAPFDKACEFLAAGASVDEKAGCEAVATQFQWFQIVDIVLSTAVMAGGAEGVHLIAKRFKSLTDNGS